MSERFGFPVFTVALLLIGGIARLLEVNGMTSFAIPWIPIIGIIAVVMFVGALIFGRNMDLSVQQLLPARAQKVRVYISGT